MAYLQDDPPLPAFHDVFPHLETQSSDLPHGLDPFTVTTHTGFLPVRLPATQLPPVFEPLQQLLEQMPIKREDGLPGLLAQYQLGPRIDDGALPDLTSYVAELAQVHEVDLDIVTALFRDYSFLASAYLLEPCWENWSKDHNGGYGLGRDLLPRCIAGPLMIAAQV